jgi:hypothetical protein
MTIKTSICDFCDTSFACSRLATALRLIESAPEPLAAPARARVGEIKAMLADLGWGFPDGGHHCKLSGHRAQVQGLTDELIVLLGAQMYRPHLPNRGVEPAQTLYDDEVNGD